MGVNGSDRIQAIQGIQAGREAGSGQKAEIAAYCGKHKENYYILDTQSFGKPSGVKDDLHQETGICQEAGQHILHYMKKNLRKMEFLI